jgi:hypothetical protein
MLSVQVALLSRYKVNAGSGSAREGPCEPLPSSCRMAVARGCVKSTAHACRRCHWPVKDARAYGVTHDKVEGVCTQGGEALPCAICGKLLSEHPMRAACRLGTEAADTGLARRRAGRGLGRVEDKLCSVGDTATNRTQTHQRVTQPLEKGL